MSNTMLAVQGVGKRYRISHRHGTDRYETLRDAIASRLTAPLRWLNGSQRPQTTVDDFWALRDVSFTIAQGEVVGLIGRNGAGKSTLLKILSRITDPTTGRVVLDGRVASLLEVGTGFHPELSGRENIFLNAAILGMSRAETSRKFDEIVAFAEVEQFLDTPVKRYSSGMYVRLAFAVAAHLEPEILVVDEVLAVGDADFQKRCLGKMHEVSRGGRTVLFVSHNMAAIQALCSRAIWLESGTVAADGAVGDSVRRYLTSSANAARTESGPIRVTPSLDLLRFELSPNPVTSGDAVNFDLELSARDATKISVLTLLIYSPLEVRLAILDLRSIGFPIAMAAGETRRLHGWIKSLPLVEGEYQVGFGIQTNDYFGDKLGLFALTVAARPAIGGIVPFAAEYRGVIDLEFGMHSA
ncbi:MAG TPA: ABC transporter ATP-binding protein [Vicinamibacterales bacterium]|nr:ABC transporter ATP-binding protein [Vicinamibacterales bacterium]